MKQKEQEPQEEVLRVPTPRGIQVLGVVEQRVGGSRMIVKCLDGKQRNCRIPGRLKRKLWIRENDIVMVEPWEFDKETKGDILLKYRPNQVDWLKKNGYLKGLENVEEF
ncbi:translation initiation factor eIF-1A [Candidatus Woesearchaeota archaeon]|nr:translation initiation factor eIF-1A [Candidatus Woesearchaeota archaeon]